MSHNIKTMISFLIMCEEPEYPGLLEKILFREHNIIQSLTKNDLVTHWGMLGVYPHYRDTYYHIKRIIQNEVKIENAIING